MLYVRGNRRDYDRWASLGNDGWSYNDVLPYFIKSEDNRNPYLANSPYHGVGGPLTVQEAPYHTPLATAFVEAGVQLGELSINKHQWAGGFPLLRDPSVTANRPLFKRYGRNV